MFAAYLACLHIISHAGVEFIECKKKNKTKIDLKKTFHNFYFPVQRPINVKSRPRLPIPDDEDPYSIAGNNCISNENSDSSGYSGSSNSNGEH